jgi:hypothetical protein
VSPAVRNGYLGLSTLLKAASRRAIANARQWRLDGSPAVAQWWLNSAAETRRAAASAAAKARSAP